VGDRSGSSVAGSCGAFCALTSLPWNCVLRSGLRAASSAASAGRDRRRARNWARRTAAWCLRPRRSAAAACQNAGPARERVMPLMLRCSP
jgi:hypothetical protein